MSTMLFTAKIILIDTIENIGYWETQCADKIILELVKVVIKASDSFSRKSLLMHN